MNLHLFPPPCIEIKEEDNKRLQETVRGSGCGFPAAESDAGRWTYAKALCRVPIHHAPDDLQDELPAAVGFSERGSQKPAYESSLG